MPDATRPTTEEQLRRYVEAAGPSAERRALTVCLDWLLEAPDTDYFKAAEKELTAHFRAGARAAAEAIIKDARVALRDNCAVCKGTGCSEQRDAYQRPIECEYCGRPRATLAAIPLPGDEPESEAPDAE